MVDPIAIYGAIATSLHFFGKIYEVVRRYMDLPEALATARSRMESCVQALDKWKRHFKINTTMPDIYYEVLWGPSGHKRVVEVLIRLKATADKVWAQIDSLIVNTVRYDRRGTYGRAFQQQLENQVMESHRSWFSWKRLVGAFVDRSKKVNDAIASFNEDLQVLQRISYGRIFKLYNIDLEHGGSFDKLFTKGMFYRRPRRHAESLHNAFRITRPTTYLALEALKMSPQERERVLNLQSRKNKNHSKAREVDEIKDFQFLLQRNLSWIPVWFRTVKYDGRPEFCESFTDIIEEINRRGSCNLKTVDGSKVRTFRVREYEESYLKSFGTILPLRQHLDSMWPREKVQVAYAIACGFYRVVGSSWGNYFESENIHAKPVSPNDWVVALHARSGDIRLAGVLDQSQLIHHRPGKNLNYHCQVYRLGVMLAEIALGRPAGHPGLSDRRIPLLLTDRRGPRDATSIAFEVITIMGQWYGNAVYFCLSLFEKPDEIKQDELDFDFEQEVLIPLRKLYEAARLGPN